MESRVLQRFIFYLAGLTAAVFLFWAGWQYLNPGEPETYYLRQGDIRLGNANYTGAIESFNKALDETPDHPGALMGRALALAQQGRTKDARAEFTHLIDTLEKRRDREGGLESLDRGALAAAYANRGILNDETGRHRAALEDYRAALRTDPGAVDGPGTIDKVLYGVPRPATIRKRAEYLYKEFQKPEGERTLRKPEADRKERGMWEP